MQVPTDFFNIAWFDTALNKHTVGKSCETKVLHFFNRAFRQRNILYKTLPWKLHKINRTLFVLRKVLLGLLFVFTLALHNFRIVTFLVIFDQDLVFLMKFTWIFSDCNEFNVTCSKLTSVNKASHEQFLSQKMQKLMKHYKNCKQTEAVLFK